MRGVRQHAVAVAVCWAIAVAGQLITGAPAAAEPWHMQFFGDSAAPVGYLDFCRRDAASCRSSGPVRRQKLTRARWAELERVNRSINESISPQTDKDAFGVEELWTIPSSAGDCEDYVLLKRKTLIASGWPTSSLLIAVAFDEMRAGHAVLLARTTAGDYVLDNKNSKIVRWYETPYQYVKVQSEKDPDRWVSVGDPRFPPVTTAAPASGQK